MILVIIHMKVSAEKRKELSQTVTSLLGCIRAQMGCERCELFYRTEDENNLCLLEEWATQKNLDLHYGSESFKILRGAMNLLEEPSEIIVYQCFQPAGKIEGRC
ncbi:hypothetical protein UWK_00990 [Desulfocapsa sulfexigens DSM 10523]|uniref:ABM domain-containing protein n=1 Tax=Desulfocapsa sulfexigens (strain DSM 10523 / SB164P1) TaxID=1167006 RepID=M1NCU4_DESSD|nr:antibiotic biosynthesis monooxygenase [Desulfocapsa sulfexigens]AGF77564.1 hypothetical protein UWK_00990 [Desulfocapsa sulfexigens DSM 10523]